MAWLNDPIQKPYTLSSLVDLLSQGLLGSMSRYCHFQIIEWCSRFTEEYDFSDDVDLPITPHQAVALADDVVVQWELFLASQYSLDELSTFAASDVVLPKTYFEQWLNQAIAPPTQH